MDRKTEVNVADAGQCGFMRVALDVFARSCEEEGGSLVEFALVAPLMVMLITAMFSLGVALNNYMVLTNGVNAGARAFALSRAVTLTTAGGGTSQVTDPCAYAVQIAKQSAPNLNAAAATFSITWTPNGGSSSSYSTSCNGIALSSGDTVQMQVTYPISIMVYGWAPGMLNMTQQTAELIQ
jgi:Flp pilus assembly protein TadG